MLDLVPGKVADVDETLNAVFRLCEYTEVGDVADDCLVDRAYRVLVADALPRVRSELFQTEGHLPVLTVDGKDLSLDFVTHLQEFLGAVKPWRPGHLGNVDETLYTWLDLNECAVVSDEDYLTLDGVADLDVLVEVVPWMWSQLLVTKGDPLLLRVEFLDDDLDLLVEGDDFLRVVDPAPRQIGDVDETVNTAEVDEYTLVGDVLDSSFKDLSLLELADELSPTLLLLCLEEGLVGNDDVAELLVDLDDLEVHGLVDICIVVADRLDVDLGTRKECLDSEYVDDHAALGAGLDEALDDLVVVASLIDAVPRLKGASLLVGKDQLTLPVLCGLYIDLNFVTNLEVWVITELRSRDDTLALVTYIDDNFSLVDAGDCSFHNLVLDDLGKGLVISLFNFFLVCFSVDFGASLEGFPIEVLRSD